MNSDLRNTHKNSMTSTVFEVDHKLKSVFLPSNSYLCKYKRSLDHQFQLTVKSSITIRPVR